MEKVHIQTGDIVSGAVLAGLGIFIIVEARGWEYLGPDGPGPGFFPLWYGICMVALSVLLVATTLCGARALPDKPVNWGEVGRALVAWTGLALCVGLLKILASCWRSGLFTFFLVAVMYRRPLGIGAGGLGGHVRRLLSAVPASLLNVALPVGRLGF